MGAKLVYEVANQTNEKAGDGTTTATVLAQAMIHRGINAVEKGANPVFVRSGMEKAGKAVADDLLKMSRPVDTNEDIEAIASISAMMRALANSSPKPWTKSARTASSPSMRARPAKMNSSLSQGLEYDKGYISPYMVTDRRRWWPNLKTLMSFSPI
jgi:chaperonin GroEL